MASFKITQETDRTDRLARLTSDHSSKRKMFNMRMEAELHWRLKVYAFQRGISMADCVRKALEQWLPAQGKKLKD